jgi:hypothetical protein
LIDIRSLLDIGFEMDCILAELELLSSSLLSRIKGISLRKENNNNIINKLLID